MNVQTLAGAGALLLGLSAVLAALSMAAARATTLGSLVKHVTQPQVGLLLALGALALHVGMVLTLGGHFLGIPALHVNYPGGIRCGPPTGGC